MANHDELPVITVDDLPDLWVKCLGEGMHRVTLTAARATPKDSEWTRERIAAGACMATLSEIRPRPGGVWAGTTSFLAMPETIERFLAAGAIDERPALSTDTN